ncbi:helix-turn-helix domain-containing protein [Faecalitalea cylindroides]|uniref:helix-turn-helix domain-containing protein n=1 Tax=Faecalitalea cylindroides TaxID=39483 RepID=UPI00242C2607|nr:helix-turn-helix transcriptional regulator [Faecalitalea cylindroides]
MKYKNMHSAIKVTGQRLKELREYRGLTASELGKKVGKHHNAILSIERGETDPSVMMLVQLLDGLGMELQDFFDERYDELFLDALKEEKENESD